MKMFQKLYVGGVALLLTLTACEKQLEVVPLQVLAEQEALKTQSGVEGAITNIYAQLKNENRYGKENIVWPEVLADNGRATSHSGRLIGEARNDRNAHFTNWTTIYNQINNGNLVIDWLATSASQVSPAPTAAQLAGWDGQLKFLRALNYFDLAREYAYIPGATIATNDFGCVPLMLTGIRTSDLAAGAKPARATATAIYDQIYKDLDDAIAKLPATRTDFPFRPIAASAQALKAKVALYRRDYATAKTLCDALITARGSTLSNAGNYVSRWRAASHAESLFEVAFATPAEALGVNVSLQSNFTSLQFPGNPAVTAGWGDMGATASLLNDLGITLANPAAYGLSNAAVGTRSADVRNQLWEAGAPGRGLVFIECTKFIGKVGNNLYLDHVPVMRIAEIYLIRAEAACADPASSAYNLTNAIADINTIRTNRGLAAYAGASTQTDVFTEMLVQRRVELCAEGNRFFDLKRLGRDIFKLPSATDLPFNDYRILPGIPVNDVQLNPNLKQNFNY
jgi:starch-binding outer membrane protein, SusD/RagB family